MKRFHVHARVDDLAASIAFYTGLFGAEPTRVETDYANWMIDVGADPERSHFKAACRLECGPPKSPEVLGKHCQIAADGGSARTRHDGSIRRRRQQSTSC